MAKKPTLSLIAPDPRLHHDDLIDLAAKTFSHSGYFNFRNVCLNGYVDKSHYDWQTSRIGLSGGKLVSHYGVWDYQMRIGPASRVRVAGIGLVLTHGDHRKNGYMTQTVGACVPAMRDAGYDMSILFGIWNFYHRFGYVRAWNETTWYINAWELPAEKPVSNPVKFDPSPRKDIAALHNRRNAAITGSAVRPTYSAKHNDQRAEMEGYSWSAGAGAKNGKIAGYVFVRRDGSRIRCTECAGDPDQVLRALGALARQWGSQEVVFDTLPYDSAVCHRLRQLNCRRETHYAKSGNAMIRIINLASTLTKMAPELSRRLKGSCLADWRGTLLLSDGRENVPLVIDRSMVRVEPKPAGAVPHAIRAGDHLAQLLIGTDEPFEIAEAARARLGGDAKLLLPVLFPNQHPQLQVADRY